ncbi:VAMP-like protein [Tripterygium wilfordii]|uniref:VAMP-like protein n=1 Tax=Tripterygium wilfordii TaxID=458696 RepID=A0A7J7D6K3_TRIWF|nr:phytolongin Phyl1.1 [Tripterygium wilfordii]XP_038713829.1 phytolongin Phyl1.1 [Tripterygium wilfordii]KAF5741952.1 VAMP-like protein [Tripterygium wilfordii]
MGSIHNRVHYCCVSRANRTLHVYSGGDHEVENMASLCLEVTPSYHKWYFETIGRRTFGFLIEDGYVYFTIIDAGLGNPGVLQFLELVRDEFKKVARKGSRGSFSSMSSINIEEQLVPVIHRLITSLEHVSQSGNGWNVGAASSDHVGLSPLPSTANNQIDAATSTKAPLLGKSSKQEKKKAKEHVIVMRDIELEEHRKSTDRGVKVDTTALDTSSQGVATSSISLQKDLGSMRMRAGSRTIRKKWWRQVWIVLAIDAAVCLILFIIWLLICRGLECTHS